jgi:hypothetical protein
VTVRPRPLAGALAAAVLLAALAGCGSRGDQPSGPPRPAGSPSVRSAPSAADLTAAEVDAVEQAVRRADGTLDQVDQQLAGD